MNDLLLAHAVHDALRSDLRRLVLWSRTCFPVATPDWTGFHRHLTTYLDAGTAVLGPVLHRGNLPGPEHRGAADDIERARRRVVLLAATVDDCLSGRGPASRTAEYMAVLDTALGAYLDDEQAVVLPVVARHITGAEWADFDAALRQPFGVLSGVALCSWLFDGAPADRREAVRELFPPAVRMAHRWVDVRRRRCRRRRIDYAPSSSSVKRR
ncbi:hypothetical protein [Yinghuangia seranimata]|uniref:hypothetical protein n=1 Tax=Yinghuangia seranimata TaxID=408067 RepID=UPI00248C81AB|nr:hypothetical protein [Yinghuangia seranimata]MDI2130860.1 hypothetical protein [Yinghuangia seranimata]